MKPKVRAIAFYLPQFFPTPENDKWWQPGFTEWTNVGKAKPLFKGHYQPRVPADLGYYDLRVPETREKQAALARNAGIEGFCYWHYWFEGRRLLDQVFKEVVETGKPDFPFCLCWANHSWYAKTWDPNSPDKMLIEQTYGGVKDYTEHFYELLAAFKDKRYIKVDGKLVFGIFDTHFKDFSTFRSTWNHLAKENGLEGFHFFGLCLQPYMMTDAINNGFENVAMGTIIDGRYEIEHGITRWVKEKMRDYFHKPYVLDYNQYVHYALNYFNNHYEDSPQMIPCIESGYDHSPRSGWRGIIYDSFTPEKWGVLSKEIINLIANSQTHPNKLLFIKAWNEWAEGNYLEPDLKYGTKFLDEFAKAIYE
jgi:hypothetical protein